MVVKNHDFIGKNKKNWTFLFKSDLKKIKLDLKKFKSDHDLYQNFPFSSRLL